MVGLGQGEASGSREVILMLMREGAKRRRKRKKGLEH